MDEKILNVKLVFVSQYQWPVNPGEHEQAVSMGSLSN